MVLSPEVDIAAFTPPSFLIVFLTALERTILSNPSSSAQRLRRIRLTLSCCTPQLHRDGCSTSHYHQLLSWMPQDSTAARLSCPSCKMTESHTPLRSPNSCPNSSSSTSQSPISHFHQIHSHTNVYLSRGLFIPPHIPCTPHRDLPLVSPSQRSQRRRPPARFLPFPIFFLIQRVEEGFIDEHLDPGACCFLFERWHVGSLLGHYKRRESVRFLYGS